MNKITLKQRIWAAIKNEAGATSIRIAKILEEKGLSSITSALNTLEKQGYVYSFGKGTRVDPKRYYTDLDTYVPVKDRDDLKEDYNCKKVLPMAVKGAAIPPRPSLYKPNPQLTLGFGSQAVPNLPTNKIDVFLSGLTMGEAEALYHRLGGYFGPKQKAA